MKCITCNCNLKFSSSHVVNILEIDWSCSTYSWQSIGWLTKYRINVPLLMRLPSLRINWMSLHFRSRYLLSNTTSQTFTPFWYRKKKRNKFNGVLCRIFRGGMCTLHYTQGIHTWLDESQNVSLFIAILVPTICLLWLRKRGLLHVRSFAHVGFMILTIEFNQVVS